MKQYKLKIKKRFYETVYEEFWDEQEITFDGSFYFHHPILANNEGASVAIDLRRAKTLSETMPEYFELEEVKPKLKANKIYKDYFYCLMDGSLKYDYSFSIELLSSLDQKRHDSYNYFPNKKQAQEAIDTIFSKVAMPEWEEKLIEFHEKKGNLE